MKKLAIVLFVALAALQIYGNVTGGFKATSQTASAMEKHMAMIDRAGQ